MPYTQPSVILSSRYQDAVQRAIELHRDQSRKSTGAPYVAHLLSVSALVLMHGGNEDEAIAGLLHDSLEDQADKIRPEDIEREFGIQVLTHVLDCTDTPADFRGGPKPSWMERKTGHLQKIAKVAKRSHRILIADKLDNVRSTLADYKERGESVWSCFRAPRQDQLWYQQSLVQAFRSAGIRTPLLLAYEEAVQELLALCATRQDVA